MGMKFSQIMIACVAGSLFLRPVSATSTPHNPSVEFAREAFAARALNFFRTYAPPERSDFHQQAALFGRGYTREEAAQIVARHVRPQNYAHVKVGPHPVRLPIDRVRDVERKMRAAVNLVQHYYLREGSPEALDHLARLQAKTFRFLDLTHNRIRVAHWRQLIFEWESSRRFMGGYVAHGHVYLPYPLVSRLQDIHHEASRQHHLRVRQLSLDILARLLHHEAEHLVQAPGWEDPAEVAWLMKNLDRLFRAIRTPRQGEWHLALMEKWDSWMKSLNPPFRPQPRLFRRFYSVPRLLASA